MHLKSELIIRIGNSCLTRTENIPVFFFFEEDEFEAKYDSDCLDNFDEYTTNNIFNMESRIFVINNNNLKNKLISL